MVSVRNVAKRAVVGLAALVALAGGLSGARTLPGIEVREDEPTVAAPAVGDVAGQVGPVQHIASVALVSRHSGRTWKPDSWDATTGRFVFRKLPGDAVYDLLVTTTQGKSYEGIDLSFADERLLRLAQARRKELGAAAPAPRPFTDEDAAQVQTYVKDLKDFMQINRALYVAGQGATATMLVELIRASDFHARKGDEVIWRIELWYFEYCAGGWQRVANQERVLRRERLAYEKWRALDVEYYPQLSVRVDAAGQSEPVAFTLPDAPDPSRGRPAGTDVRQETRPHVLAASPATTQPGQ